jgi:hypothetical protein
MVLGVGVELLCQNACAISFRRAFLIENSLHITCEPVGSIMANQFRAPLIQQFPYGSQFGQQELYSFVIARCLAEPHRQNIRVFFQYRLYFVQLVLRERPRTISRIALF